MRDSTISETRRPAESPGGTPAVPVESPVERMQANSSAAWHRPRMPSRMMDLHVNYAVLGESGLGKTTFINNLISSFQVRQAGAANDGSPTSMQQFKLDPNSLRTVLEPMDIPESSRRLLISIQDVPGWGHSDINMRRYLRTIVSYLLELRVRDYEALCGIPKGMSADAMCGQLQHSITACLYFVPPHRVKKIDLILMAAISQLVTIIPIISKADTMTDAELAAYRADLQQMLDAPNKHIQHSSPLPALDLHMFQIEPVVMETLGLQQLPIAIMCSREQEPCSDTSLLALVGPNGCTLGAQPVRQYTWGTAYPLLHTHKSDLIPLKRLLLGDQVESLYVMLEDSYKHYVSFCEEYEDYEQELPAMVQDVCVMGRHMEYDDYHTVRSTLLSTKERVRQLKRGNAELAEQLGVVQAESKDLKERSWR